MYQMRNTLKKGFTTKVYLKIGLTSFNVIIHIYTIQVPTFLVLSHLTKLALKHLFGVSEEEIRSNFCNLFH